MAAVWAALVRNRWLILGCITLVIGAAAIYTMRQTPTYEATATLRIQERQLDFSQVYRTLSSGVAGSDIGTERAVLESRALREDAVRALGLQVQLLEPQRIARERLIERIAVAPDAEPAQFRIVPRADGRFDVFGNSDSISKVVTSDAHGFVKLPGVSFALNPKASEHEVLLIGVQSFASAVDALGGISINKPRNDAYILTITYHSTDRLLARDVPNAIATSYIARRQINRTAEATTTVKFLRDQLTRVQGELAASEESFRSFQERAHVLDPQVEISNEVTRLIHKESERSSVQAEHDALRESLAEIEAAAAREPGGPSPYRRLVGLPFVLRTPAASTILTALITAENDRASRVGATAQDPDVVVLNAKIRDLENQLHAMSTRYLAGLGNQLKSFDTALNKFQRKLDAIPGKQLEYARLGRKVKALDEVHTLLQQKLKEAEIAEAAQDASVQIVDAATAPNGPSSPDPMFNGLVALAMGLGLGLTGTLVRELRDKSVHTRKDIVVATGVPVLALIPRMFRRNDRVALITEKLRITAGNSSRHKGSSNGLAYTFFGAGHPAGEATGIGVPSGSEEPALPAVRLAMSQSGQMVAESYGLLHTNLAFAHTVSPVNVLVITSPLAQDGKTTCATNLAITLALRGSRTLLVDADLRRGVIHTAFESPRAPGLSDFLAHSRSVSEVIRSLKVGEEGGELHFVTSGSLSANPSGLLESSFQSFLATVRERFDFVVIDSPPVNIISDASLLGRLADGVVLVARSGFTHSASLASATEQLARVGVRILGVVLNDIDFKREAGYDASYRYYTASQASSTTRT